jgi:hypothetical protein
MADTKISALPASTTPLAGTEVLPIVQSGATKQVSVTNLTADRAISATAVTASTGNFIVGTSGQGIDFSATPGTGTSELLADYEEGDCSLTVTSIGGTLTTASATAKYTKTGRTVLVTGVVNITNNGTGSGGLSIAGLPFTPGTAACGVGRESVNNGFTCSFMISSGSTTMAVYAFNNTYPVATGSVIQFSVSYTV